MSPLIYPDCIAKIFWVIFSFDQSHHLIRSKLEIVSSSKAAVFSIHQTLQTRCVKKRTGFAGALARIASQSFNQMKLYHRDLNKSRNVIFCIKKTNYFGYWSCPFRYQFTALSVYQNESLYCCFSNLYFQRNI